MKRCCAILCLVTIAAPAVAADANRVWRELFAQPSPAEANQHLRAVLDACGNDVDKLKALIASDTAYEPFRPGWMRRKTNVADGNTRYEVEYLIRVPLGYTPKRPWPLLLVCHGQGSTGAAIGKMMEWLLGGAVEKYIIVAPTMPGPKFYSGKPYQEQSYLKPLGWARLHLNVDDDRIYVSGYSQGGHQTWHLASMYPSLFAAAAPMAGGPVFEGAPYTCYMYLQNISHLPLWSIWGEKDTAEEPAIGIVDINRETRSRLKKLGNTTYRGTELPGVGHGGAFPKRDQFVKFLKENKRVRAPEKFTHVFHLWHHRRGYYLQAVALTRMPMRLDKPIRVTVPKLGRRRPTPQDFLDAGEKMLKAKMFHFFAELNRSRNQIHVRGYGVRTLRLYLLDGMIDPSRELTVRYFNRLWRGEVKPSARAMLLNYAATRDATRLVYNEIDLENTGKRTIRFPK